MVRLFAALLFVLAACLVASAKPKPFIEINLETKEAFLGDTVVVEVRWSGLLDPIDFSLLERDAEIVRETAGTRIAVVEGQVIEIASRRIELQPRAMGLLTIGPLEADGVTSNSVTIEITEPRSVAWSPGEDDVRLTQTVSEPNPWLQQQVVLNIELRTRHPVFDEVAILPTFDGFRVVPVFTERRTLEEADGGWAKTAWRYLLFPQRSGAVTIPGARFAGTLAKSRAERGTFELLAEPTQLNVKPSAFGQNNWWVAASALTIKDEWSGDPTKLSAGDEVDRIITVSATGILPEQIPDVVMDDTRGLTITPLGVDRQGKIVGEEAQASAAFRFRVRAMSPVPVFLDTVRMRWWNTAEDRAAEAIIPARRIDIGIPDRDSLVDNALSEQGWWDRLLAAAAAYGRFAYVSLGIVLVLAATAAVSLGGLSGLRRWLAARRVGREMKRAARRGDAAGLLEQLRTLTRTDAGSALMPMRVSLERSLFGNGDPPDLAGLARQASAVLRRSAGARSKDVALPSL
jgi:hypothetical protein